MAEEMVLGKGVPCELQEIRREGCLRDAWISEVDLLVGVYISVLCVRV